MAQTETYTYTQSIELERVRPAHTGARGKPCNSDPNLFPGRGEPAVGASLPQTPGISQDELSLHDLDAALGDGDGGERVTPVLHPPDKGRHAWQFLAAATLVETWVWGLPYTVGVLHAYWHTHMFPEDESTLTLAATLQTGLMFMSTALLGPLFTTFPRQRRLIQAVGLVVASTSIIAAGFVTKASHLVATIGCLYPFAGALYLPCATIMYEWFIERRGLASGILFAGTGIGGTIFPLVVSGLLNRFGYKAAMVSLGLAFLVMNAIALMFVNRRVPLPARGATHALPRASFDWSVTKTRAFWVGMAALLLTSLGNFNPTLWIPTFAETVGAKRPDGTALVAIMNAVSVPSNVLMGWISDRTPGRVTVLGNCLLAAVSVLILWGLGTSSGMLVAFSVLWGFSALSFVSLWSKLITRTCKDRDPHMNTYIFSLYAVLRGVGNLTSGPISTKLLRTGVFRGAAGAYGSTNFGAVLVYTGVTILCGGLAGIFFPN